MSEWSVCPACGNNFRLGVRFCDGCGRHILYTEKQLARLRKLEQEKEARKQEPRHKQLGKSKAYMLCLHCGAHNPQDAKSCDQCGKLALVGPYGG